MTSGTLFQPTIYCASTQYISGQWSIANFDVFLYDVAMVLYPCRQIEKKILDEILGKMVYDSRIRSLLLFLWKHQKNKRRFVMMGVVWIGPREQIWQAPQLSSWWTFLSGTSQRLTMSAWYLLIWLPFSRRISSSFLSSVHFIRHLPGSKLVKKIVKSSQVCLIA